MSSLYGDKFGITMRIAADAGTAYWRLALTAGANPIHIAYIGISNGGSAAGLGILVARDSGATGITGGVDATGDIYNLNGHGPMPSDSGSVLTSSAVNKAGAAGLTVPEPTTLDTHDFMASGDGFFRAYDADEFTLHLDQSLCFKQPALANVTNTFTIEYHEQR